MILWLALSCMFALWCHNASEEETSCADAAGSTCLPDTRDKTWEQKKCEQKRFRFNCITVARPHTHTHTHTHTQSPLHWLDDFSLILVLGGLEEHLFVPGLFSVGAGWRWTSSVSPRPITASLLYNVLSVRHLHTERWKQCIVGFNVTRPPVILSLKWLILEFIFRIVFPRFIL